MADHIGSKLSNGHYVLQLRNGDRWSTCDDTQHYLSVEPFSGNNYLFVYKKLETKSNVVVQTVPQQKIPTGKTKRPSCGQTENAKKKKPEFGHSFSYKTEDTPSDSVGCSKPELDKELMVRCKVCNKDTSSGL